MKPLLLSLLLSFSFLVQAQNWCPPGAVWHYDVAALVAGGYSTFTYEKDTLLDGEACKKIMVSGRYYPVDPTNNQDPLFTFQRNDTVYYHYAGSFRPVFFWGAQLGDTIQYFNNEIFNCDSIVQLLVDSVGTTVINNDTLRFYRTINVGGDTANTTNPIYPHQILAIERLGAVNAFPIPFYLCYTDGNDYNLRCYSDSTFALYQTNPAIDCDYLYNSISQLEQSNNITLYPNPATNQLNISIEGQTIAQYQILDYTGKMVLSNQSNNSDLSIDVSELVQGVYLIRLELKNGQYAVRKFTLEK
jgi:hypothetical protein